MAKQFKMTSPEDLFTFHIDGVKYGLDDLTFREQLALRPLLVELVPGEEDDPPIAALIPAAVCVVRRRTEPEYTLDQAVDSTWKDLEKKSTKRPTRRGAQTTGTPASTP